MSSPTTNRERNNSSSFHRPEALLSLEDCLESLLQLNQKSPTANTLDLSFHQVQDIRRHLSKILATSALFRNVSDHLRIAKSIVKVSQHRHTPQGSLIPQNNTSTIRILLRGSLCSTAYQWPSLATSFPSTVTPQQQRTPPPLILSNNLHPIWKPPYESLPWSGSENFFTITSPLEWFNQKQRDLESPSLRAFTACDFLEVPLASFLFFLDDFIKKMSFVSQALSQSDKYNKRTVSTLAMNFQETYFFNKKTIDLSSNVLVVKEGHALMSNSLTYTSSSVIGLDQATETLSVLDISFPFICYIISRKTFHTISSRALKGVKVVKSKEESTTTKLPLWQTIAGGGTNICGFPTARKSFDTLIQPLRQPIAIKQKQQQKEKNLSQVITCQVVGSNIYNLASPSFVSAAPTAEQREQEQIDSYDFPRWDSSREKQKQKQKQRIINSNSSIASSRDSTTTTTTFSQTKTRIVISNISIKSTSKNQDFSARTFRKFPQEEAEEFAQMLSNLQLKEQLQATTGRLQHIKEPLSTRDSAVAEKGCYYPHRLPGRNVAHMMEADEESFEILKHKYLDQSFQKHHLAGTSTNQQQHQLYHENHSPPRLTSIFQRLSHLKKSNSKLNSKQETFQTYDSLLPPPILSSSKLPSSDDQHLLAYSRDQMLPSVAQNEIKQHCLKESNHESSASSPLSKKITPLISPSKKITTALKFFHADTAKYSIEKSQCRGTNFNSKKQIDSQSSDICATAMSTRDVSPIKQTFAESEDRAARLQNFKLTSCHHRIRTSRNQAITQTKSSISQLAVQSQAESPHASSHPRSHSQIQTKGQTSHKQSIDTRQQQDDLEDHTYGDRIIQTRSMKCSSVCEENSKELSSSTQLNTDSLQIHFQKNQLTAFEIFNARQQRDNSNKKQLPDNIGGLKHYKQLTQSLFNYTDNWKPHITRI